MKRLTSLLLSGVLALSLSVPAFAAEHNSCTETSYTYTLYGQEMQITEHRCANGDSTVRVDSKDEVVISSLDADTQEMTVTVESDEVGVETSTFTLSALDKNVPVETQVVETEDSNVSPYGNTYSASSAYWNFSCYSHTNRVDTVGTFWRLTVPSTTSHSAYDQNDSALHGYADNFREKLHAINNNIYEADRIMRNAGQATLIDATASALGSHFAVLGGNVVAVGVAISLATVTAIIRTVGAGLDSNPYWYEACQRAKEATDEFLVFRSLTQAAQEESSLFAGGDFAQEK